MVDKMQKSGDQKAIMEHFSFLARLSRLAIAQIQRDFIAFPATMVVPPVPMNDDESADSHVVERIEPNIVRLNEQLLRLQVMQLIQRNIPMVTSVSDFFSLCAVSQCQGESLSLQSASSPGLALGQVPHYYQGTPSATPSAPLADAARRSNDPDTNGDFPRRSSSQQESNSRTSLATSIVDHPQSTSREQQALDDSLRSSNLSAVSSTIGAPSTATEFRSGTATVPQSGQPPQSMHSISQVSRNCLLLPILKAFVHE